MMLISLANIKSHLDYIVKKQKAQQYMLILEVLLNKNKYITEINTPEGVHIH